MPDRSLLPADVVASSLSSLTPRPAEETLLFSPESRILRKRGVEGSFTTTVLSANMRG